MPHVYIGLATTFHDPAIAIVAEDGAVRFAEASERPLQYKRAVNCEPDLTPRMESLIRQYVHADEEVVVATSWSGDFARTSQARAQRGAFDLETLRKRPLTLNRSMVPDLAEAALMAQLDVQQRRAGLGVLVGLSRAHGHSRISLRRYDHHLCHAALAAYTSPFDEAACLIVDGMGETGASAIHHFQDGRLTTLRRHMGRESVGFFFGLITDLCGFDQSKGEEWKVMGLAPYGQRDSVLTDLVNRLWSVEQGDLVFADTATISTVTAEIAARHPGADAPHGWADLARVGQDTFEAMMDVLVDETARKIDSKNLILAGGCALNSSYNGKIAASSPFQRVHVPSAPADDGNALGAAFLALTEDRPAALPRRRVLSPYLGSRLSTSVFPSMRSHEPRLAQLPDPAMITLVARLLEEGRLIGWATGAAEFGPRALGARSILADPRPADMKKKINAAVKFREPFRPFAPSILADHAEAWFEDAQPSPYMERTLKFRQDKRALVPAVVHEDGTGRLQTVTQAMSPRYHALISAFHARTGIPLLLNTSFNVMGKPILHSAEDAILMFYTTGLDAVVVEDWILVKDRAWLNGA